MEQVLADNLLLRRRIDVLERENRELKRSIYDLSLQHHAVLTALQVPEAGGWSKLLPPGSPLLERFTVVDVRSILPKNIPLPSALISPVLSNSDDGAPPESSPIPTATATSHAPAHTSHVHIHPTRIPPMAVPSPVPPSSATTYISTGSLADTNTAPGSSSSNSSGSSTTVVGGATRRSGIVFKKYAGLPAATNEATVLHCKHNIGDSKAGTSWYCGVCGRFPASLL